MKNVFYIDYLSYITLRWLGPTIRCFPLKVSLSLGQKLGELFYYFDTRHRSLAYSNIKTALGNKLSPRQLSNLTKSFYRNFGQNLIEILLIPLVNKDYINKYINMEGLDYIYQGFAKGKGVILLGIHAGSWELSNVVCANLGFPFSLFVRDQKRYPWLDKLLNQYRQQKGCRIIQRHKRQVRQLVEALRNNEAIGMTLDQGGRTGMIVKFFDKYASMAQGAVRLALRYDAAIIPSFFTRVSGPQIKLFLGQLFQLKKTGNLENDIYDNLQRLVQIFEEYILQYPQGYLWLYRIWKYTEEKDILILDDGKTGHLRQAQTVATLISNYLKSKDIVTHIDTQKVKFKSNFAKNAILLSSCFAGKYYCQGCLRCLKNFLEKDTYRYLTSIKPDIIISCGSSLAPINFILSRENLAKSIVVLRPSILSTKRFDLVIIPKHDRPPKRKNIVVTEGALNLIDEQNLENCKSQLINYMLESNDEQLTMSDKQLVIGLLIGGDTKDFHLKDDTVREVIWQLKSVATGYNADILATTSRRTTPEIERLIKEEFQNYSKCKLMVIANEKNLHFAIGGILGLCQIVVASPESISMISEAVNSKKYVLVFKAKGLNKRHQVFLKNFEKHKYIYLVEPSDLKNRIKHIWLNKPHIYGLRDNLSVREAISKIL